jgi:DHA3 family macrolide efflux protein-like MFS transporter
MLPVFAAQNLNAGALEVGLLWSALGAGMLVMSTWLASLSQGDLAGRFTMIFRSMVVGGFAMCGLNLLSAPLIAGTLVLVIGGTMIRVADDVRERECPVPHYHWIGCRE